MKSWNSSKLTGALALLAIGLVAGHSRAETAEEVRCEGPLVELRIEGTVSLSEAALSRTGDILILHDRGGPLLVSTRDGRILHRFRDPRGEPVHAVFSPRGTYVLLRRLSQIELYDSRNLADPPRVIENPFRAQEAEWSQMAMSPDETVLGVTGRRSVASGLTLGWVSVFDTETGREVLRLPELPYPSSIPALSSDGRRLALRPAETAPVTQVWDVPERRRVTRIAGESDGPTMGFVPGTKTLVQDDGMDGMVLRDSSGGERIETLPERFLQTSHVVFSPLEAVAAIVTQPEGSSPRLEIWDFEKRSGRCFVDGPFHIWSPPSFSGDGRWLAVSLDSEERFADAPGLRVRIYAVASGGQSNWPERAVTAAVEAPQIQPANPSAPEPAPGEAPPEIAGIVPTGDEGDHCHLYKVPLTLSEEEQEEVLDLLRHPIGRERTEERTGELGFADFGHFVTTLGEEELTKRVAPIPGSDLKATAAVYYTDESLSSAEGWDSISLALAVGPEEVEDPFRAAGASVFEGNYTGRNGLLRVKTVVESETGTFLLGLECDTTVRKF